MSNKNLHVVVFFGAEAIQPPSHFSLNLYIWLTPMN